MHCCGGHRFAEQDDSRLQERAATCEASRRHLDLEPRLHRRAGLEPAALEASHHAPRSVQLDHALAARVLVEAICVLCDDCHEVAGSLHRGQRHVARIWPGRERDPAAVLRDTPVRGWIGEEALDRGHLDRVVLRPQPTLAAKSWDAALRRDAGARQREAMLCGRDQLGGSLETHASHLNMGVLTASR